jgi:LacI family transcriptional regulator
MAKRPTQADVAQRAGVSRATVSYVLNKRTEGRIPITEETRHNVLKAARELGYTPHALARSLRSGLTHTIGLLIPDTNNPHYMDLLSGVEAEVVAQDYYLVLVSATLDPERERHCLRSLVQQRLDGLILAPTFADLLEQEIEDLLEHTSPVVFVNYRPDADCAYADVRSGAEALMDHLIALGHQRIGFVHGVARDGLASTRMAVYRAKSDTLGMHSPSGEPGRTAGPMIVNCGHTMEDGYQAARQLLDLDEPPTAIWTVNDLLAVGALRAIRERGLRVPEDISLAGFDDIAIAAQLYPPLTTVAMHAQEVGRRAARLLFRRIEDPALEPLQEMLDTELVVRASTATAPS